MFRIIFSIVISGAVSIGVMAQSTTFTYQGKLTDTGSPTANYDFEFRLYDALTGGNLLATQQQSNVPVTNGVFSVKVDLSASFSSGATRYLEIGVKNVGAGSFTTLSPRQLVTSEPYSIRSLSASNADLLGGIEAVGFLRNSSAPQTAEFNINGNGTVGGNLLVGTPFGPQAKLSVIANTFNAGPNTAMFAAPNIGGNTSYIHYGISGDWYIRSAGFFGKVILQDMSGGSIGIGTATPGAKVHIVDNTTGNLLIGQAGCGGNHMGIGFVSSFTNCTNYSLLGNGTDTFINRPTGGVIAFRQNNNDQMKLDAAGNLIVNGFTHLNSLSGGGTTQLCRNPANEVALCGSSLRYKTNVADFSRGLDLVRRLRPVTFMWKENHSTDLGLVAEDVAGVEPLLTTTNARGEVEGVKYDRIGVVAINAIKEQQAEIESLRKENIQQEQRINALTDLVCSLRPKATVCKARK